MSLVGRTIPAMYFIRCQRRSENSIKQEIFKPHQTFYSTARNLHLYLLDLLQLHFLRIKDYLCQPVAKNKLCVHILFNF